MVPPHTTTESSQNYMNNAPYSKGNELHLHWIVTPQYEMLCGGYRNPVNTDEVSQTAWYLVSCETRVRCLSAVVSFCKPPSIGNALASQTHTLLDSCSCLTHWLCSSSDSAARTMLPYYESQEKAFPSSSADAWQYVHYYIYCCICIITAGTYWEILMRNCQGEGHPLDFIRIYHASSQREDTLKSRLMNGRKLGPSYCIYK